MGFEFRLRKGKEIPYRTSEQRECGGGGKGRFLEVVEIFCLDEKGGGEDGDIGKLCVTIWGGPS